MKKTTALFPATLGRSGARHPAETAAVFASTVAIAISVGLATHRLAGRWIDTRILLLTSGVFSLASMSVALAVLTSGSAGQETRLVSSLPGAISELMLAAGLLAARMSAADVEAPPSARTKNSVLIELSAILAIQAILLPIETRLVQRDLLRTLPVARIAPAISLSIVATLFFWAIIALLEERLAHDRREKNVASVANAGDVATIDWTGISAATNRHGMPGLPPARDCSHAGSLASRRGIGKASPKTCRRSL